MKMDYTDLIFSDAHLRQRRGDEQYAIRQIVRAAKKYKVQNVWLTGDGIDKQSNRSAVAHFMFRQLLDPLREAKIKFFFLQGQHDWDDPAWPLAHEWAVHAHQQELPLGPYMAYGLDFQHFGVLQEELSKVPDGCNLLLAHQAWGEWMRFDDVPQGDFAQVPGHMQIVISGDLHQKVQEKKHKNKDGDKILTISPGATCAQKMDEPHEHFYILVRQDGMFEFKLLQSRAFIDWDVMTTKGEVDDFVENFEAHYQIAMQKAAAGNYPAEMMKPYLHVTYSHKLGAEVVRRVNKVVSDRAFINFRENPPEEKAGNKGKPDKKVKGEAVTPLTELAKEVSKEEKPEVFELTSRLLQASSFPEEFARWRAEQME